MAKLYTTRTTLTVSNVKKAHGIAFKILAVSHLVSFSGKKMWKFDHRTKEKPQKLRASKEFKGIPRDLSAAFEDQDGGYIKTLRRWPRFIVHVIQCKFCYTSGTNAFYLLYAPVNKS